MLRRTALAPVMLAVLAACGDTSPPPAPAPQAPKQQVAQAELPELRYYTLGDG